MDENRCVGVLRLMVEQARNQTHSVFVFQRRLRCLRRAPAPPGADGPRAGGGADRDRDGTLAERVGAARLQPPERRRGVAGDDSEDTE